MLTEIEFEIIGSQFRQQDTDIIVVAKLLSKIAPEVETPLVATALPTEEPIMTIPIESDVKQIITMPEEAEKPKKRKLKQKAGFIENGKEVLSFKLGEA